MFVAGLCVSWPREDVVTVLCCACLCCESWSYSLRIRCFLVLLSLSLPPPSPSLLSSTFPFSHLLSPPSPVSLSQSIPNLSLSRLFGPSPSLFCVLSSLSPP
ncbi:hypothetical protein FKM82_027252 [Ascaphus truei]